MNKKILKVNLCLIMLFIFISCTAQVFAAGSFSLSKSSSTITEGKTDSFTINGSNATGRVDITSSDTSVATVSSSTQWLENNSFGPITITAKKAGTAKITVSGTVADKSGAEATITKTISVTVKAKSTSGSNSGSGNNTGGSTTKPSTPTEKYTDVNEKVYSTTDGLNVRKSANGTIIGSLSKGDEVTRTGIGNQGWSRIKLSNGTTAYVSSSYLTKTKPAEDKPKTEEPKKNTTTNEEVNNTTSEGNNETKNNEVGNNNTGENITTTDESLGLSSLEIAGVNFSDGFDPSKHIYGLKLNFFVKNLDITAKANKEDAKIEIIGNQDFVEGENNVTVLLTSADGKETATYQIKVTVPSEIATAPQNNIQFYIMCGSIIITAIVLIAIVTAIYRKVSNKSSDSREENEKLFENPYVDDKPKKEKSKGKHSN
jgi:hypothetical protein